MPKNEKISLRIPLKLKEELQFEAELSKLKLSAYIFSLLESKIAEVKSKKANPTVNKKLINDPEKIDLKTSWGVLIVSVMILFFIYVGSVILKRIG